jgi:hypothetical protein
MGKRIMLNKTSPPLRWSRQQGSSICLIALGLWSLEAVREESHLTLCSLLISRHMRVQIRLACHSTPVLGPSSACPPCAPLPLQDPTERGPLPP